MPTKKKKRKFSLFKIIICCFVLLFFVTVGAATGWLIGCIQSAPVFNPENLRPSETSFVYDIDGNLIAELHEEQNRIKVSIDRIPEHLKQAFIAIEDHNFYKHFGVDIKHILAALWTNIKTGDFTRGGSTITQQLVKNAFLTPKKSLKRKVQEAWLAIQLERKYTKDEILEFYLNMIPFGHSAYGVQAAAQIYFGKDVEDLTLAESAMLAGITNAPAIYSPYINFDKAKQRQAIVLNEMVEMGFITEQEAEKAKQEKLHLIGLKKAKSNYKAPYFVDHVIRRVVELLQQHKNLTKEEAFEKLYNDGLKIYTTVDMELQKKAEEVMADPDNYPKSIEDKKGNLQPQGAVVIIDPRNGHIKALVGGREHKEKLGLNRATQSYRQPGSAFKPIAVYAPAVDALGYTPATVIDNSPVEYPLASGKTWAPENYNERFDGLTTIRRAIELSVNVVAVKVLDQIGIDRGIEYAQKLGIKNLVLTGPKNDRTLSLALGGLTKGVTPLEMASAYGTFANKGIHVEPIAVLKVTDKFGRTIIENEPKKWVALSEESAYIMTDMLRGVVKRGTAWRLADLPFPVAGKTGTTSNARDVWFVGYTPHLVGAVWIGHDEPTPMKNVAGGKQPAMIWKQIMNFAHKDLPNIEFEQPSNIVGPIKVCKQSGKLPGPLCEQDPRGSQVIDEIFIKGTEPTEICDVHVKKAICVESGLLATEYCPPSSVKEKVFIQRKEPYKPSKDGRIPVDVKYETPKDYCNIHKPMIIDIEEGELQQNGDLNGNPLNQNNQQDINQQNNTNYHQD